MYPGHFKTSAWPGSSVRHVFNKGEKRIFPYTGLLIIAGENSNHTFKLQGTWVSCKVLALSSRLKQAALRRLNPNPILLVKEDSEGAKLGLLFFAHELETLPTICSQVSFGLNNYTWGRNFLLEAVEIPFHGKVDTMSLDNIPIQFILGCHQHRAQRADDIKEVLNILDEKNTSKNKTMSVAVTIIRLSMQAVMSYMLLWQRSYARVEFSWLRATNWGNLCKISTTVFGTW